MECGVLELTGNGRFYLLEDGGIMDREYEFSLLGEDELVDIINGIDEENGQLKQRIKELEKEVNFNRGGIMTEKRFTVFKSPLTGLFVVNDELHEYRFEGVENATTLLKLVNLLNNVMEENWKLKLSCCTRDENFK